MSEDGYSQLISYVAPSAPATRRPAQGDEPYLRPEIGFTPKWFGSRLGIDFGERWHVDPAYREASLVKMRRELKRCFPGANVGRMSDPEAPPDLLTGVFGATVVAAIYCLPVVYAPDNWPNCAHRYLTDEEASGLQPPDLESNDFFCALMEQVDWMAERHGRVSGFVNWQGVLNNAYRLRGEEVFTDMVLAPERARRVFGCVAETMRDGASRLYKRQREAGFDVRHFTVSNCLVNMVSADQYRDFLFEHDAAFAEEFGLIGIHNCAWNANAYLADYARVPNVGYIDMGIESDLSAAKALFPDARRAVMYKPMDLAERDLEVIRRDLERMATDYGPCDVVLADIELGTPDEKINIVVDMCEEISERFGQHRRAGER